MSLPNNWASAQKPRAMRPSDRLPLARLSQRRYGTASPEDDPPDTLRRVLATGRARFGSVQGPAIAEGPPRPARLVWQMREDGSQVPAIALEAGLSVALPEPWYVDPEAGLAGPLALDLPGGLATRLLAAPPLPPLQADRVRTELARLLPGLAVPAPQPPPPIEDVPGPPQPVLTLFARPTPFAAERWHNDAAPPASVPMARVGFRYGTLLVPRIPPPSPLIAEAGRLFRVLRDPAAEQGAVAQLGTLGLARSGELHSFGWNDPHADDLIPADGDPATWLRILAHEVPRLRATGWDVAVEPDFPIRLVHADGDIAAELSESSGIDWLELHLGVTIDGEQVDLVPPLVKLLAAIKGDLRAAIAEAPDEAAFTLPLSDGRLLSLPLGRIRPLLLALLELFDDGAIDPAAAGVRFTRHNAAELAALEQAAPELVWQGGEALRTLGRQLREAGGAIPVATLPETFKGSLRPYQAEGRGLAAVPARSRPRRHPRRRHGPGQDRADAGARPDRESRRPARPPGAGRLPDQPGAELVRRGGALRARAARAGAARPDRARRFAAIPEHDLVITTYPLLARDHELLAGRTGTCWCWTRRRRSRTRTPRPPAAVAGLKARPAPVPDRHAAGEPPRRAVVAVRLPDAGLPRHATPLPRPLPHADRKARRRGGARTAGPAGPPVPAAPDQGGGGRRTAAEDRDRRARVEMESGQRGALRSDAPGDARARARRDRRTRPARGPASSSSMRC